MTLDAKEVKTFLLNLPIKTKKRINLVVKMSNMCGINNAQHHLSFPHENLSSEY